MSSIKKLFLSVLIIVLAFGGSACERARSTAPVVSPTLMPLTADATVIIPTSRPTSTFLPSPTVTTEGTSIPQATETPTPVRTVIVEQPFTPTLASTSAAALATIFAPSDSTAVPAPDGSNPTATAQGTTPESGAPSVMKITAWQSRNQGEPDMKQILHVNQLSQACEAVGADGKLLRDRYGYNPIDPQCALWGWGAFPAQVLGAYLAQHGKLSEEGITLVLDQKGWSVKIPGWMGFIPSEIRDIHTILGSWADVAIAGKCKADGREGTLNPDGSDWSTADFIVYLGIYAPNQFPWNRIRDGRPCPPVVVPTATPSH